MTTTTPTVEMYYRDLCGFCARADCLLSSKGIEIKRINIWNEPGARDERIERASGASTVPQIFIDGEHIGGSDALITLEMQGELDAKLGLTKAA